MGVLFQVTQTYRGHRGGRRGFPHHARLGHLRELGRHRSIHSESAAPALQAHHPLVGEGEGGPYSQVHYTGTKSKDLEREINDEWDRYQEGQRGGLKAGAAEEAMECLQKMKSDKNRNALSKAREKAKEAVGRSAPST